MNHHTPIQGTSHPLRYGCRVMLYRQSQDGYVVATSSSMSPVGVQQQQEGRPISFEHAIFTVLPGDTMEGGSDSRREGDMVKYGHMVRLLHHTHQQPLSHDLEKHAAVLKGNLRVGLKDNRGGGSTQVSQSTRWRVMPRYRLRVEGEAVADGDPVMLQSSTGSRYLNVAEEVSEVGDGRCLEVSCGRVIQGFQIHVYDFDVGELYRPGTLRCGDCVTLLHTEEHKYLMADLEKHVCYLRTPESRLVGEGGDGGDSSLPSYGSGGVRDMSFDVSSSASRAPNTQLQQRSTDDEVSYLAVFVVEAADARIGGALRPAGRIGSAGYRLKGLSSGLYLCTGVTNTQDTYVSDSSDNETIMVSPQSVDLEKSPLPELEVEEHKMNDLKATFSVTLTSDPHEHGTLFRIRSAASAGSVDVLQNGNQIFLEAPGTPQGDLWVVAGAAMHDEEAAAEVTVASLAQSTTTRGSVSLCGRRLKSMRDGLEIRRLPVKACEELHLIRGLLPPLERYVTSMQESVCDSYRVREVRENLRHLQRLCYQQAPSPTTRVVGGGMSHAPHDSAISCEWQTKLFHQGVHELVLQVVRATVECPHVVPDMLYSAEMVSAPKDKPSFVAMRYAELGSVVDTCFDFVGALVSDRPRYAQSLRGHVDFIMSCCSFAPSALRCLCEFYRNNAEFVELPMARHRLEFFLDMLTKRGRDPLLLRVIELFSMCDREPMVEGQKVIMQYFLDASNAQRLLCPTQLLPAPANVVVALGQSPASPELMSDAAVSSPHHHHHHDHHPHPHHHGQNPLTPRSKIRKKAQEVAHHPARAPDGTMAMVGIPHSVFADDAGGDSMSIGTSAQYRGRESALGEILFAASNSEDHSGMTFFPIEGLSAVLLDWPEVNDDFIPYFVEQTLLFASLASGGRSACQQLVFQWIPKEVLVMLMESSILPTVVHAAMVSLFSYAVVDMGETLNIRQDLRSIRCIITGTVAERPASMSCALSLPNPAAPLLAAKAYVFRYLESTAVSGDEEVAAEYLATLQLTEVLVNGGVIGLEDYHRLLVLLVDCCNPSTDDQLSYLATSEVHDCRVCALRLINTLMDALLSWRSLQLVDRFRLGAAPPAYSQLFQFTTGDILQRHVIAPGEVVQQPKLIADGMYDVEHLSSPTLSDLGLLFTALMDLSTYTTSLRVRRYIIHLFFRLSNFVEELHHVASGVQLLTSEASLGFYADINRTSADLDELCKKSFLRSNTIALANTALASLDGFLATLEYGAAVEKFAMMRHVGIPRQLLYVLQRLPLPISDSSRGIIFKVVSLLQTMSQEEMIREDLLRHVAMVAPLAPLGTNVISLLRTLYLQDANRQRAVPVCVMTGVAKCLSTSHTSLAGIEFFTDLLAVTDSSGRPLAHHQQAVWHAIVSDSRVARHVQFRTTWCGPKAQTIREHVLQSRDYYVSTGRLSRHLATCNLLHRIALHNELVKPEEIRHEVFGLNSVDALLSVVTDIRLPVFFRRPYVSLVLSLLLCDDGALPEVFAHRSFGDFVFISMMDVGRYLQLRGGNNFFSDIDEDLERREDAALHRPPANVFEKSIDDANFGLEMYEGHVFGSLLMSMKRVCSVFQDGVEQLGNRLRSQLKLRVNEFVDMLCDVTQYLLKSDKGSLLSREHRQSLYGCLTAAKREGFHGTSRWRTDAFDELFHSIDNLAKNAMPSTNALSHTDSTIGDFNPAKIPAVVSHADSEVDSQVLAPTIIEAGSEQALTFNWLLFLKKHLTGSEYAQEGNLYLSAAGIMLRNCDRGTAFFRFLVCNLPMMSTANATHTLHVIRQLVQLAPANPLDDSALLLYTRLNSDTLHLSMEMSLRSRQALISKWPGDTRVENPVPLLALVTDLTGSEDAALRHAALRAATALLRGGHRGMQESYNDFCHRSSEEQLFFTLRNHLTSFVEDLRRYYQALARGTSPQEASHLLAGMESATLELLLIQLLCAGQFTPLQLYLIAQPDNNISVNLLETMVELVAMSPKVGNEVTAPFFLQLMRTVSETVQGPCRANQDCFVAYRAADYLTLLLADHAVMEGSGRRDVLLRAVEFVEPVRAVRKGEPSAAFQQYKQQRQAAIQLHTAALSTLLALIEGRQDPDFIAKVLSSVDLSVLGKSLDKSADAYERVHGPIEHVQSHGLFRGDFRGSYLAMRRYLSEYWRGDHPSGREEIQDELALGVSVYIFFRACHDMESLALSRGADEFVDKRGRTIQQALKKTLSYRKFRDRVGKVEVIRDGSLERVYFRILGNSEDNLSKSTKLRIINTVVRTSDNERLQSFFRKATESIVEMNTYAHMRRHILLYLANYCVREMRLLALLLILAMNLTMLIGIRAPISPYESGTARGIRNAIRGIGIAIIAVQSILVVQAITGPVIIRITTGWERYRIEQAETIKLNERRDIAFAADRGGGVGTLAEERENAKVSWARKFFLTLYFAVTTRDFFQHAFFLFVCIMGFLHHPVWHAIQLLQVMFNSPVLDNLFKALYQQFMPLFLTLVSLLFMIFIFTTISFYKFSELFDPIDGPSNGFNCYTLSQCWLVHIDTMRESGGIGEVAAWPTFYSKDGTGYWFTFFRLVYYLLIVLLMLNLFLGVIVDSLAQLRQYKEFITVDQEKKCFICGVDRNVFDVVQAGTYETHVGQDHYMWHYIFFMHYLSEKDPSTFTGQEAYVSRLVQSRDITFFPIGRSIVLSSDRSYDDDGDEGATTSKETNSAARVTVEMVEHMLRKSAQPMHKKMEDVQETLAQLVERLLPPTPSVSTSTTAQHSNAATPPAEGVVVNRPSRLPPL